MHFDPASTALVLQVFGATGPAVAAVPPTGEAPLHAGRSAAVPSRALLTIAARLGATLIAHRARREAAAEGHLRLAAGANRVATAAAPAAAAPDAPGERATSTVVFQFGRALGPVNDAERKVMEAALGLAFLDALEKATGSLDLVRPDGTIAFDLADVEFGTVVNASGSMGASVVLRG